MTSSEEIQCLLLNFQEYILPTVTNRQKLLKLHKEAKKLGLDIQKYNQLQERLVKLNRRLRNPLKVPTNIIGSLSTEGGITQIKQIHDNGMPKSTSPK